MGSTLFHWAIGAKALRLAIRGIVRKVLWSGGVQCFALSAYFRISIVIDHTINLICEDEAMRNLFLKKTRRYRHTLRHVFENCEACLQFPTVTKTFTLIEMRSSSMCGERRRVAGYSEFLFGPCRSWWLAPNSSKLKHLHYMLTGWPAGILKEGITFSKG